MYIEKRRSGKSRKYYLVHSFRENGKVRKIRRYLGRDLSTKELGGAKKRAEGEINKLLEELRTEIFNFALTRNQIKKLNDYENEIEIHHLEDIDWRTFTEEFVYNTNAIEGSTVGFDEVKKIIEKKKPAINNDEIETRNVSKAVEFIRSTKEKLSIRLIKRLHKICFSGSKEFAGKLRNVEVVIRNYDGAIIHKGVPVSELDRYLNDMIKWYGKNKNKFKSIVLAAIIHNQFEHIHPFQDGNGRVGRLLLNFILIKNKYPPINIRLRDRKKYYEVLREYSIYQNLRPTVKFFIDQYNKTLRRVTTKRRR